MFKKVLKYTLSILLVCIILSGCTSQTTQAQVGKNLDKKLSNLYSVVKNLDTIDNNYINNPDLQIVNKNSKSVKNIDNFTNLSLNNLNNKNYIKFENETNEVEDIIQEIVVNELEKRLSLNNNGYCNNCNNNYVCDEDGYCANCHNAMLCNENGNCISCNNKLTLNDTNTCENCGKSYLTAKVSQLNNTSLGDDNDAVSEQTINDIDDTQYHITPLSTIDNIDDISATDNIRTSDTTSINTENNNDISNPVSENTTTKENLNDTTNTIAPNDLINNYGKVDTAETTTQEKNNDNQTIEENNAIPDLRIYYYTNDSFSPVKLRYNPRFVNSYDENNINQQLSNYLYKVQRLYAMTEDALEANNILNTTKQELLELITEIRELNENITNGTCTATIQQLQALTNYTSDIKNTIKNLKKCNGDLENEVSNINSNIPSTIASSVDVMNSNYVKLINLIDTRITYHESAISTLEQIKYLLEDAINSSNISEEEVKDIIEQLSSQEQNINSETTTNDVMQNNNIEYIMEDNEAKNYIDKEAITGNNTEQESSDNIIDVSTQKNNTEEQSKKETSKTIKNIDTYKTPSNNQINYDVVPENNFVKNNIANENDVISNSGENTQNYVNNNNNSSIIDNNYNNNDTNSTYDVNYSGNTNNSLLNENYYKNSVINQNNLNNNDGYGGYYYANDGQIHNNGINNNNEYGNNGNTIENNLNRNNNTNTYGYNTMLDIINQGTVNNGINTL